ncbi:MAG: selenocysteine-specific translation elongation factor [Chloroflexi bacterium]|nr:selenocysteine-specific translation elongation factor [Chloroflexota bacterium]
MRLVGTAGHVDHGKSTLVQALTGINPDRLLEEQARAMTIDLGFAWLTLPHGETISLVDVPGHEGFIKNMLAGVGGIDVALLVVAADEGIMPQTREHLAILDLMKIQGGVVALTKTDLDLEPGWLDLVQEEIRAALASTCLRDAEIIPVSAKTRVGLNELQLALERVLARVAEKFDHRRPRLPVDRVFTMSGFGTVVTGTLSDGHFSVGDDVEIAPRGARTRIRGLQAHKQKLETALPGGRVAINLANVPTDEIARGEVIVLPDTYAPTTLLDARIEWLPSAPKPLAHGQALEMFLYASEVGARVRLLETDALAPGQRGWAQLLLHAPLVAAKGDRFILRYASPSITVGGGEIVAPHPRARHKRKRPEVIQQLERAAQGTPAELVRQFIEQHPALELREMVHGIALDEATTRRAVAELTKNGDVLALGEERSALYVAQGTWERWREKMMRELAAYHKQFPLRAGMPRQELKSKLNFTPRVFDALLEQSALEQRVRVAEKNAALATHRVEFDAATQVKVNALLKQFARAPYNPPSVSDAEAAVGAEVLNALVEQGAVERIALNVLLTPHARATMQQWVVNTLQTQPQITAAELRDHFDTSRKYAIAFLEHLDAQHVTKRVGDARVLR